MRSCGLLGPFSGSSSARPTSTASSPACPTRRSTARPIPTGPASDAPSKSAPTCRPSRPTPRQIRTYSSTGGTELVPEIATEFGLRVIGRRLDRQEHRPQRARNPLGDRTRPQASATSTASWSATRRSTAASRPATNSSARSSGSSARPGPGHHRRNLEYLARASRTRLGGRFHRRPRPALLGGHPGHRRPSTRRSASTTSCARPIPASAS